MPAELPTHIACELAIREVVSQGDEEDDADYGGHATGLALRSCEGRLEVGNQLIGKVVVRIREGEDKYGEDY
ncbi:DUF4442 domain-containing protein [Babesia caballi]|uniref:DUF4442 domain-containing protein n=1 Tax=Babesia caballi TaxID=5871 RepID=A0AAV4LXC0_BABCB|nr:DUF4442 domain-containing protein [Babesia caballi]